MEPSAFAPSFVPSLAIGPRIFPPVCFLHPLLFLGPICLVRLTVTFQRKFRLLTLLYHAKNDCPLGSLTRCGVTRLFNTVFHLGISAAMSPSNPSTTNFFLSIGFAVSTISGAATDPSRPAIGKNPPFLSSCSSTSTSCVPNSSLY